LGGWLAGGAPGLFGWLGGRPRRRPAWLDGRLCVLDGFPSSGHAACRAMQGARPAKITGPVSRPEATRLAG